ncbi:MAG: hypothetical protein KO464_03810 [Candidatus Methanofastidiosum sp.]|nr:hypothetical protein [Methanofastidiosum sp.]
MDERELFYVRERREPRLVPRKTKEKILTDPFILTCLIIQLIMIVIVLILHLT